MSTYLPKKDDLNRKWFVIDAEGAVLGKLATTVADILSGKRKPIYTPFLDTGDHVVVINAEKISVSGNKEETKLYHRHTGYLGGLKTRSVRQVRESRPSRIVEEAVKGMLPKTRLGRAMFGKLKVYAGPKHPHDAQRPTPLAVK
ncbi:MAG: 50S ribosomal protein L13 [Vicinamibacteria bacterium]|nr:50S ribosomal protein L13 [Vicinamibacteria bacterium]